MMHSYRRILLADGSTVYRVGYYDELATRQSWVMLYQFADELDAAAYVSYLNGGGTPKWLLETGKFPEQKS